MGNNNRLPSTALNSMKNSIENYPNIAHILRTIFNSEDGLSEDSSIRIYLRTINSSGKFEEVKSELISAFSNKNLCWKNALLNDLYEVFDAESEEDARDYARRILWNPVFGKD